MTSIQSDHFFFSGVLSGGVSLVVAHSHSVSAPDREVGAQVFAGAASPGVTVVERQDKNCYSLRPGARCRLMRLATLHVFKTLAR